MKYTNILVHVDSGRASPLRAALAASLAKQFGATLQGLCAVPRAALPIYTDVAIPVEVIEAEEAARAADLEKATEIFAAASEGLAAACESLQGDVQTLVADRGRYADLVVVGQADDDDPACTAAGLASAVAFHAGAGVLVAPFDLQVVKPIERVVIAWNGAREGQRAVQDALPLIAGARSVTVLNVGSDIEQGAGEPAHRLCERLAAWGITAKSAVIDGDRDEAGELLLDQCLRSEADLLVLGAYGHSRFREFLLGGVTRFILQQHSLPVLISH